LDRLRGVRLEVAYMSGGWRAAAIVRRATREHIATGVGGSPSEACSAALAALVVEVKA